MTTKINRKYVFEAASVGNRTIYMDCRLVSFRNDTGMVIQAAERLNEVAN